MDNISYIEDGSLDYYEAQEKMFYIFYNTSNIEERRRELDELCIEVSSDFRENFQDGRVRENHYWHHFFEVLSTIHLSIAICYFDLKNVNKVIEYATLAAETTMVTGELYDQKIKSIGSLILAACANENKMLNLNPQEYFREKRLKTMKERFDHYYSVIVPN